MRYDELAETYARIEETTKRLEMTEILVGLLREATAEEVAPVVYLTRGKLRPDFEGLELGLAEKLVLRALSFTTGFTDDHLTALLHETGDLGLAAERALRDLKDGRRPEGRTVARQATLFDAVDDDEDDEEALPATVLDVYGALEDIAEATGSGSQERKIQLLKRLLIDATPLSARYIVRTVTGKLRLGVADMTLLDALAHAAAFPEESAGAAARSVTSMTDEERARFTETRERMERAYNVSSDLGRVARTVKTEGVAGLEGIRLQVGIPVRAMLAERLTTSEEILEKLGGRGAAEYKYDGLRLQGHLFDAGAVEFYSRRLENLTGQFPDVAAALREAFKGREAIVEGEVVAVDPDTGEMLPFQKVSHRRGRKHGIEEIIEEVPVAIYLFDLLYLDGDDLTGKPLPERRWRLEEAFAGSDGGGVRLSNYTVVKSAEALDEFFTQSMADNTEGVMVKSVADDSHYRAGARGWQWIKYKRDYRAELTDTADLVVVGAFAGRGRRRGWYGALLCATYNPDRDVFETVCKLGTGFDDEMLAAMPPMFEPHKLDHKHPRVVSEMEADHWFEPAIVAEVAAAEITVSPVHTAARGAVREGGGLALRFPRFTGKWREDKAPEDATTGEEVLAMYQAQWRGGGE